LGRWLIVQGLGSDPEIKMQDKPYKKDSPRGLSNDKMRADVLDGVSVWCKACLFTIPPAVRGIAGGHGPERGR
jgi:hypothetical protein